MFTTVSIYFLMLGLIFWTYCGYLILLFVVSTLRPAAAAPAPLPDPAPALTLLIPCYNEEAYIARKLDNLRHLRYPAGQLAIRFLDGGSTDRTMDIIRARLAELPGAQLLATGVAGKINQLNHGLARLPDDCEIVVSTDVDAELEPDTLERLAAAFAADPQVAVVGANISPEASIGLEDDFWRDQNLLRIIESEVYTASIVVAPCFAFRRALVREFPADCIADDIYTAFKANTEGYRTLYLEGACGRELRSPRSIAEFIRHKYRKGNAYLVELFRFFYRLPCMNGWWKTIYLTKLLQLAVIPWVIPYFLLCTLSLLFSGWGLAQVAAFGILFLTAFIVITSLIMSGFRRQHYPQPRRAPRPLFTLFLIGNLILILVGLSFPFYRQTSCYRKIA